MLLYIFLTLSLFALLLFSVGYYGKNFIFLGRKTQKYFLFLYFFIFWFLTAFRHSSIGNDTSIYIHFYRIIENYGIGILPDIEIGYKCFCWLLSKISTDPQILLIVCASICYGSLGTYICRYSMNIAVSVVLAFCICFSPFTNILRQALAMIIILLAYIQIKNGKKIFSILLILLASLFHTSALITLLWFLHKYIPKKINFNLFCGILLIVLSISGILNSILQFFLGNYVGYFESEYAGSGRLGITYECIRNMFFYIIIHVAYAKKKNASLEYSNAVLALWTVCLGFSVNLFSRASVYYILPMIIDIPNAFCSEKIKNRDLWVLILGGVMLSYFIVVLIIRPEWNNLYPYKLYWR